ncbi:hypothetical protein WJX82_003227 [Trebouxia sp. C0006]
MRHQEIQTYLCATVASKSQVREGDKSTPQDCVPDVDNDDHFQCKLGYNHANKCAVSLTPNMSRDVALRSDFASASAPLEAWQGRDEKDRLVENPTAEMPVSFGNSQESAVQKADYQVKVQQGYQIVFDPELEVFMRALILKKKQGADPYARALTALHPNTEWTDIDLRHAEAQQLMEWIVQNPDREARLEVCDGGCISGSHCAALEQDCVRGCDWGQAEQAAR